MGLYFDWNATTPPLAAVVEAMREALLETWANPASVHAAGRLARARVEDAREAVAKLAGADPRDVVLTSGGTEANNLALMAPFVGESSRGRVLVTSRLEHPSVVGVASALGESGRATVRWVSVTTEGTLDMASLEESLDGPEVALVAVQTVNHETGVVQRPHAAAMLGRARERGIWVHEDAVQAWGKRDVRDGHSSSRSLAAHKFRGPKGIGALILREGASVPPLLRGGAQERGIRPGTVDPAAAAGLAVAARHALSGEERYRAVAALRDHLETAILARVPGARVNGGGERAPHVTNISFPACDGPLLVAAFDLEGLAVSSGSACSAGTSEPSPVISAMLGADVARRAVRFSLGETTTREMVDAAIEIVTRVVART